MCSGPYAESLTKEITLPDDDPDSFSFLLACLSGKPSDAVINFDDLHRANEEKLVATYMLADKYELTRAKETIIDILKEHVELDTGPVCNAVRFFSIAAQLSDHNTPLSRDKLFDDYFKETAPRHLRVLARHPESSEMHQFAELLEYGGSFAKRIGMMVM